MSARSPGRLWIYKKTWHQLIFLSLNISAADTKIYYPEQLLWEIDCRDFICSVNPVSDMSLMLPFAGDLLSLKSQFEAIEMHTSWREKSVLFVHSILQFKKTVSWGLSRKWQEIPR